MPDVSREVVGEIGQADLGGGADEADRAHEQPHRPFLSREDMLDRRADLGAPAVGPCHPLAHRPTFQSLAVDVGDIAVACEPGLVLG